MCAMFHYIRTIKQLLANVLQGTAGNMAFWL